MRKIIISLLFMCFLVIYNNGQEIVHSSSNKKSQTNLENNLLLEEAFLRSIGPKIAKAIIQYYGNGKLYFLERITNIEKDRSKDTFDVTVQVVTYERSILPPYGLETITFRIPGYKVLDFGHKDIEGKDLPEDKFN